MILFRPLFLVLLFLMPLSVSAFDMNNASCDELSALSLEEKSTYFSLLQYTQSPSALSFIIGPQCSFLGETQILAYINDPQLTIHATPEVLYYSPSLEMLFVSYQEKNTIAYAMLHDGDMEPLDFFIAHKSQAKNHANTAKRFAAFSETLQSSSSITSSSSSSSLPRSNTVVTPPVPRIAVNTSTSSQPVQNIVNSGTVASIPSITPEQPRSQATSTPSKGAGISIWQILIAFGAIGLLVFVYVRRRNSMPI